MLRVVLSLTLALGLCAAACAEAPGFVQSDLGKAKSEALSAGKLVLIYFNLPG